MGRLDGKVAFLSGATGGIGEATARLFAAEGARVMVTGRRIAEGEAVAAAIVAAGGEARFVQMDVGEPDAVERAVTATVEAFGRLDILFSNAGGSSAADGPVTTGSLDEFWRTMRVDLFGTYLCSRYAIPAIIASGGGSVINVASIAGLAGLGGRDGYAAAKGGVITLTRSTAREFVCDRVRVNAIAPGLVLTERIARQLAAMPDADRFLAGQPLGAVAPQEIALAAVFLASDESRTLTGQVIAIDGGAFQN